jgi:hypothetical protein
MAYFQTPDSSVHFLPEGVMPADVPGFPAGAQPISDERAAQLTAPAPLGVAVYEAALDAHLDSVAVAHRYRDRFTFALRAGYLGPYHDEGVRFATWMDTCNAHAYALFEDVTANGAVPPSVDEFIASLPAFL